MRIKTNLSRYIDLNRFSVSMKDTSLQESAVQFHRHPHVIPSIDHAVELEGKKRRWNHPTVSIYATQDQEAEELIKRIQEQIAAGIDPREICVVARTNALIDDYKKYLTAAGIDHFEIKRRQADDRSRMGIRLATMHRVKGLEFTTVLIVAANKNYIPLKSAVNRTDPVEREAAMTGERCLLYVAMTRAKKKVMISAFGAVSEFLG